MKKKPNAARRRSGFTLAETVISIALIVLITAAIALGTTAAIASYRKMVLASEAQTLLDTAMNAVSDELRYATRISSATETVEGETRSYYEYNSANYGVSCELAAKDGKLVVISHANGTEYQLLGSKTYTSMMTVGLNVDHSSAANGITAAELEVYDPADGNVIASAELTIPQLNK